MLQLDSSNQEELAFALHKAVKQSGLALAQIAEQLQQQYGVELTLSGLSHFINRETARLQHSFADIGDLWGG